MADRVLIGPKDGTYGLYISKPTFDVKTCGAADLVFDSRLGHYGSVVVSGTSSMGQTVTFPDVGYVPMGYAQCYNGANYVGNVYLFNTVPGPGSGINNGLIETAYAISVGSFEITRTSIKFLGGDYVPATGQSTAWTIRYVVWRMFGG